VATIGRAGGDLCIADGAFSVPLSTAQAVWKDAIPALMRATP
jgi:hypothetical protein